MRFEYKSVTEATEEQPLDFVRAPGCACGFDRQRVTALSSALTGCLALDQGRISTMVPVGVMRQISSI